MELEVLGLSDRFRVVFESRVQGMADCRVEIGSSLPRSRWDRLSDINRRRKVGGGDSAGEFFVDEQVTGVVKRINARSRERLGWGERIEGRFQECLRQAAAKRLL